MEDEDKNIKYELEYNYYEEEGYSDDKYDGIVGAVGHIAQC